MTDREAPAPLFGAAAPRAGPRPAARPTFIDRCAHGHDVRIWTHDAAFDALRAEWDAAMARARGASVFVSPDYVETAWRHFRAPTDRPWLMTVHADGALIGMLPLVQSRTAVGGVPVRRLRHIGMWEGDRPGVLSTVDPEIVWQALFDGLRRRRRRWDLLELGELDEGAWPLGNARRLGVAMRAKVSRCTQAAYQPIVGEWDDYLAQRSRNTRQGHSRRQRQFERDHPDASIDVIDDPDAIVGAFERYVDIERRGWKLAAGVGLWSDDRQHAFYRDLLPRLARRGRASVWLLRADGADVAGLVRFAFDGIVYERMSTYDAAYAAYSPSTLLCMEAVRRLFGSSCRESDALGMAQPLSERPAIRPWYDGMRQTHRLVVANLASPMLPALLAHHVSNRWRRAAA